MSLEDFAAYATGQQYVPQKKGEFVKGKAMSGSHGELVQKKSEKPGGRRERVRNPGPVRGLVEAWRDRVLAIVEPVPGGEWEAIDILRELGIADDPNRLSGCAENKALSAILQESGYRRVHRGDVRKWTRKAIVKFEQQNPKRIRYNIRRRLLLRGFGEELLSGASLEQLQAMERGVCG